jgi:hypothetical protein
MIQIFQSIRPKFYSAIIGVLIFALLLTITLASRWPLVIQDSFINPDEAELLASGREAFLSPVPFSTWVTSTVGPVWPLFLASLKIFGFPLTITSGHFLAASMVAFIGLLAWNFSRQSLGPWFAGLLTFAWWLPLSIGTPVLGGPEDFNALTTNLLPCLILFLIVNLDSMTKAGNRAPVALGLGVLAGMAFLSKYQVGPIVVAVVASLIISKWSIGSRRIKESILASVGFFLPTMAIAAVSLLSGLVNFSALRVTFDFFLAYGDSLTNEERVANFLAVIMPNPWVVFWILLSLFSASLGSYKSWLARVIVLVSGLFSVYMGGMGFGHYLLFIYSASFISLFIIRDNLIENWLVKGRQTLVFSLVSIIVVTLWWVPKVADHLSSGAFREPLSLSHVDVSTSISRECPPGSRVLVWGWASEFYVNYEWRPAMPHLVAAQIIFTPANIQSAEALVQSAISSADCVFDATGEPFFSMTSEQSLLKIYPWAESALRSGFENVETGVACETCTLWVRRE